MTNYMPKATNFDDIPKRDPGDVLYAEMTVPCPVCDGRGMWNLTLNAYGPGKHFQASCFQCNGWGYVEPGPNSECVHEFDEMQSTRMFEHNYKCRKCGSTRTTDSSG